MEYVFNSLEQTFYDSISNIPATLGLTFASADDDPLVMKDRGLYFDRTNDLAILGTSGSNLKLNPSFSLFFWSRFLDDFAYILGRYDEVYNKLFTMDISMGFIKVEVTIDGQETEL